MGPIAAAGLAEVARLREIVVVVVAKLGVGGVAAGAWEVLRLRRRSASLTRLRCVSFTRICGHVFDVSEE